MRLIRSNRLSPKQIEIYAILFSLVILLIVGVGGDRGLLNFYRLPDTHIESWFEYLPGTWEAVDVDGNVHRIEFPACDDGLSVINYSASSKTSASIVVFSQTGSRSIKVYSLSGNPQRTPIQVAPIQGKYVNLRQSGSFKIGVNAHAPAKNSHIVVIQPQTRSHQVRHWNAGWLGIEDGNSWTIDRANEQYAIVSTPVLNTRHWLSRARDEIYIERVDDDTFRSTNQKHARDGRHEVLTYHRLSPPLTSSNWRYSTSCLVQY